MFYDICELCGSEAKLHTCDFCGAVFCASCFVEKEGNDAYDNMLRDGGYIFCPECYQRTAPNKRTGGH